MAFVDKVFYFCKGTSIGCNGFIKTVMGALLGHTHLAHSWIEFPVSAPLAPGHSWLQQL